MFKRIFLLSLILLILLVSSVAFASKTVVRFQDWHMTEDVWLKCLQETKASFEELHPNIEIKFEPVAHADKSTKFIIASEAKNAPDVIHMEIQDIPPFIKKHYLLNLNDLVKNEGSNFMDQWAEAPKKICEDNNILYAMPDNAQTIVLFYNTELFKKAGLDPNEPPKTWEEFREYGIKLTNGKDQWGFGMVANNSASLISRFLPVLWSFGGDIFNEDMTKCVLDSPDSIAAVNYFVELYTKYGITPPAPNEMGAQDVRTFLAQGKVAMSFGSGWTVSIVDKLNPDLKAAKVLKNAPLPLGKRKATFAQMDFWGISAFTKVKDASWEWMKYLTSKDVQEKFFKDNGVTSARVDVGKSDMIMNDKFAKTICDQIPYGLAMPMFIAQNEVNNEIIIAIQEALTKQKTPEQSIKDACSKIDKIIERNK